MIRAAARDRAAPSARRGPHRGYRRGRVARPARAAPARGRGRRPAGRRAREPADPRAALVLVLAGVALLGALRAAGAPIPDDHWPAARSSGRWRSRGGSPRSRSAGRRTARASSSTWRRCTTGPERLPGDGRVSSSPSTASRAPARRGPAHRARTRGSIRPSASGIPAASTTRRISAATGILLVGNARADRIAALTPDAPPWPVAREAVGGRRRSRARLPETSAALLAGLLLGERRTLPRETDESFRRAGVYHVLAVSGFNVALLAALGVRRPRACVGMPAPRRGRAWPAAVLVAFALVVGGQPSVLRATVMGLLLLAGVLLERESQLLNALALAALLLLALASGRSLGAGLSALLRGHRRHRLPRAGRHRAPDAPAAAPRLARGGRSR